jgi:hypothetical protein
MYAGARAYSAGERGVPTVVPAIRCYGDSWGADVKRGGEDYTFG